ncbi:hypothetical protein GVAV_000699 [Gurleya vavrai]
MFSIVLFFLQYHTYNESVSFARSNENDSFKTKIYQENTKNQVTSDALLISEDVKTRLDIDTINKLEYHYNKMRIAFDFLYADIIRFKLFFDNVRQDKISNFLPELENAFTSKPEIIKYLKMDFYGEIFTFLNETIENHELKYKNLRIFWNLFELLERMRECYLNLLINYRKTFKEINQMCIKIDNWKLTNDYNISENRNQGEYKALYNELKSKIIILKRYRFSDEDKVDDRYFKRFHRLNEKKWNLSREKNCCLLYPSKKLNIYIRELILLGACQPSIDAICQRIDEQNDNRENIEQFIDLPIEAQCKNFSYETILDLLCIREKIYMDFELNPKNKSKDNLNNYTKDEDRSIGESDTNPKTDEKNFILLTDNELKHSSNDLYLESESCLEKKTK